MPTSSLIDERWKDRYHIVQIVLITLAIGLSFGRLALKSPPASRANVISVTVSIKSLIIIAYQLLTERRQRFRKWYSLKAFAILNTVEVVLWFVVFIVTAMTSSRACGVSASACALGVIVIFLAIGLMIITFWVAAISIAAFRQAKRGGALPKSGHGHSARYSQHGLVTEYDFRPEASTVPKAYQGDSTV